MPNVPNLTVVDIRAMIHGLKMSGLAFVEQDALTNIRDRIDRLPGPEQLIKLNDGDGAYDDIIKELGSIMQDISHFGGKDAESKVRYKSKTGLPPRYKILEWKEMTIENKSAAVHGIVKMSEAMDKRGEGVASEKLLSLAKNILADKNIEKQAEETISYLMRTGFVETAGNLEKMAVWWNPMSWGKKDKASQPGPQPEPQHDQQTSTILNVLQGLEKDFVNTQRIIGDNYQKIETSAINVDKNTLSQMKVGDVLEALSEANAVVSKFVQSITAKEQEVNNAPAKPAAPANQGVNNPKASPPSLNRNKPMPELNKPSPPIGEPAKKPFLTMTKGKNGMIRIAGSKMVEAARLDSNLYNIMANAIKTVDDSLMVTWKKVEKYSKWDKTTGRYSGVESSVGSYFSSFLDEFINEFIKAKRWILEAKGVLGMKDDMFELVDENETPAATNADAAKAAITGNTPAAQTTAPIAQPAAQPAADPAGPINHGKPLVAPNSPEVFQNWLQKYRAVIETAAQSGDSANLGGFIIKLYEAARDAREAKDKAAATKTPAMAPANPAQAQAA